MGRMVRVRCNRRPLGDIRQRQPKSPGQKPVDWAPHKAPMWNKPPETAIMPVEIRWANLCKDGHARRTHCGHKGHEEV